MKIASFNINNVNRRLPNLLRWLRAANPDVVALQELKATDAEFPAAAHGALAVFFKIRLAGRLVFGGQGLRECG